MEYFASAGWVNEEIHGFCRGWPPCSDRVEGIDGDIFREKSPALCLWRCPKREGSACWCVLGHVLQGQGRIDRLSRTKILDKAKSTFGSGSKELGPNRVWSVLHNKYIAYQNHFFRVRLKSLLLRWCWIWGLPVRTVTEQVGRETDRRTGSVKWCSVKLFLKRDVAILLLWFSFWS